MIAAPDAQFAFVAACCRLPAGDVKPQAAAVTDWNSVATLATRHRVVGFVAAAIGDADVPVPADIAARLTAQARRNTEQNLRNLGEEARIDAAMRAAGVAPLFLKGTALGLKLYRSLAIKTSWDIDVLVAPEAIGRAGDALRSLGYRPKVPDDIGPGDFDRYSAVEKEIIWTNPARGTAVELHRKLTYYTGMLPGLTADAARQSLPTGAGRSIDTFADPELYAYLSVHGTIHGWARLKWLADLNALIDACGIDVATLHRRARAIGAGRASAVALTLCRDVFGRRLDGAVDDDADVRRIVRMSTGLIGERGACGDTYFDRPANTLRLLWIHARILPDLRAALGTAGAILARRRWRFQLALPGPLVALTTIGFAPGRLLYRMLRFRALTPTPAHAMDPRPE